MEKLWQMRKAAKSQFIHERINRKSCLGGRKSESLSLKWKMRETLFALSTSSKNGQIKGGKKRTKTF